MSTTLSTAGRAKSISCWKGKSNMKASCIRWCAAAGLCALTSFAQSQTQPGPAAPQRTIMENRVTRGAGDKGKEQAQPPETPSGRTVDSLVNSTEDLNSIRDGYLRRLSGDGCPPDVAIRVADLRARLQGNGPGAGPGRGAKDDGTTQESSANLEGSLLILAAQWYQLRPETTPARAATSANREMERARLLDFVLSPGDAPSGATPAGADAASVKAELDRLLAGCRQAAH